MRWKALAVAAIATVTLAGCYETATPRQYEPGVYKGSEDPLRDKLQTSDLQSALEERFRTAAEDR
ncbi:MAG: hypothetical protein R3225_00140 [Halofilum sp. (in: g-proteobacteria)]|nr:hypothetical protein [Halofilum sp. (in: g-proteobacteria)]